MIQSKERVQSDSTDMVRSQHRLYNPIILFFKFVGVDYSCRVHNRYILVFLVSLVCWKIHSNILTENMVTLFDGSKDSSCCSYVCTTISQLGLITPIWHHEKLLKIKADIIISFCLKIKHTHFSSWHIVGCIFFTMLTLK